MSLRGLHSTEVASCFSPSSPGFASQRSQKFLLILLRSSTSADWENWTGGEGESLSNLFCTAKYLEAVKENVLAGHL